MAAKFEVGEWRRCGESLIPSIFLLVTIGGWMSQHTFTSSPFEIALYALLRLRFNARITVRADIN
jgi:hypothetical protein